MILFANGITGGTSQIKTLKGQEHIVAPATLVLEGIQNHIFNGEVWPIFAPADALLASIPAWNSVGLTVNHPILRGKATLLESPESWEKFQVGQVFNAIEKDARGIHAELWFNTVLAKALGTEAEQLGERIRANEKIENSTGYLADIIPEIGQLANGDYYVARQANIRPNHHAILTKGIGNCSIANGCGLFNCGGTHPPIRQDQAQAFQANTPLSILQPFAAGLGILNAKNYFDIIWAVEEKLYALEGFDAYYGMEAIGSSTFVYRRMVDGDQLYFKRTYTIDAAGAVTFGEPEQVRKSTNYPAVNSRPELNIDPTTSVSDGTKGEEDTNVNRPVLVNQIISNTSLGKWGEDDRAFLEGMTDAQFLKMFNVEGDKIVVETQAVSAGGEPAPAAASTPDSIPAAAPAAAPAAVTTDPPAQQATALNADQAEALQAWTQETQAEKGRIADILVANEGWPDSKESLMKESLTRLKGWEAQVKPSRPVVNRRGMKIPRSGEQEQVFNWQPAIGENAPPPDKPSAQQ